MMDIPVNTSRRAASSQLPVLRTRCDGGTNHLRLRGR